MVAQADFPETRYAVVGEDRIAYQVFGEGDVDLIFVPTSAETIELRWDWPAYVTFLRRLGARARVVMFDRRGLGASDAPSGQALPSWERWADEALAVLDAVASDRAVVFGTADAGPIEILFAASHPERTRGLILANTMARFAAAPDYPEGLPEDAMAEFSLSGFYQRTWGTEALVELGDPDAARDPAFRRWRAKSYRLSLTPREAGEFIAWQRSLDVRDALASVRVPTLVLHREGFNVIPPAHGRYLAEHIRGARFALVPGRDATIFTEPAEEVLRHIEEFLDGLRGDTQADRALAAVLFTDIVGSTERASALGDRAWRNLLESHDVVARTVVEQHRGQVIKMTGDGMLATFDGPGHRLRGRRS